jgi:hypothetical protein
MQINTKQKAEVVQVLMAKAGISHTDALMSVDMAEHAAHEAYNVLERVCERLPNHLFINTMILAIWAMHAKSENVLRELVNGGLEQYMQRMGREP